MIEIPLISYETNAIVAKAMTSLGSIKSALLDVKISKSEMSSNQSKHYPTIDLQQPMTILM